MHDDGACAACVACSCCLYIYTVYIIHICMYIQLVLQSASSCLCRKTYNLVMEPHCLQDAIGNRTKHCLFGNAEHVKILVYHYFFHQDCKQQEIFGVKNVFGQTHIPKLVKYGVDACRFPKFYPIMSP